MVSLFLLIKKEEFKFIFKTGSLRWLGEYSECLNVTEEGFHGKYCILKKPFYPGQDSSLVIIKYLFKNYFDILIHTFFKSISYGICVPNKCTYDDISLLVNFGKI